MYDKNNDCTITKINPFSFTFYLIKKPSFNTISYIILTIILAISFSLIFIFKKELIKKRRYKQYFKITKLKAKIFLIIFIPTTYIWGLIINLILYKYYYYFNYLEGFLVLFGIVISYYISTIIEFFIKK